MATASGSDIPECSICFESFTKPKLIPCGHTFCLDCVERYIGDKTDTFLCPICQQDVQIPEGGAKMFPTNFLAQTSPPTRQVTDQPLSTVQQKCPNHRQRDIDFYCNNCKGGFCLKCLFKQHKDHDTLDIESEDTRIKAVEELQHSQKLIQNKIKDLEKSRSTLLKTREHLQSLCDDSCAKVTEKTEKIVSDLRKNCENTKRKMRKKLEDNKTKLDNREKEVTSQIDKLQNEMKSNIPSPSETTTLDILQCFPSVKELEKLCQSLKDSHLNLEYLEWKEKDYNVDIDMLGSIVTKQYYIPSFSKFRFDIDDVKQDCMRYYSKDKLYNYNIVYICGVGKYAGDLDIGIGLLPADNPKLNYCIINGKLSLLNIDDDNKTITKTVSNRRLENGGWWVWRRAISWAKLIDTNNGYLTSNNQFVIQCDITQIREISFK